MNLSSYPARKRIDLKLLLSFLLMLFISAVGISSCADNEPSVKGTISDADNELIILEKADHLGQWVVIDSTRTSRQGNFSFSIPKQGAPEIFRLNFNNRYVYFPVDSIENITLTSSAAHFDIDFHLDGSDNARNMESFEKELIKIPENANAQTIENFKRAVFTKYIQNGKASVVAYYAMTKTRNGKPLFDPADPENQKYWGAVATSFKQFAPNDPRTRLLEQTALEAMRNKNSSKGITHIVNAPQTSILDFTLTNEENREVSLSQIIVAGKPTLLIFTLMNQPESPDYNRAILKALNETGDRYSVMHVSFDTDLFAWREGAVNLPWVTVIDPTGRGSRLLSSYATQKLPTFYIINSNGELADRTDNIDQLPALLRKY